ncbi:MAG: cell division protein FtsZ [Alphaproteobacteria bacterium]|nr:cell division protein FtsZ [Beijerinckiaceae bacterium]NBQ38526.1 cell division protein FtsZ [Alphaproteobacteria bacterium]
MTINLSAPDIRELKPRITVFGVGGAGGNAVNNMIEIGLQGCEFVVGNTDAQALTSSKAHRVIQMGMQVTEGLGAGSQPEVGRAAAEEVIDEIRDQLAGAHMVFVTAGMGGGTGTGAAPVIARAARDMGILTVGVVTKPFQFEGTRRMRLAEQGISELQKAVDTLIVIPNQNLFRVANEQTTFADAFAMADRVLYSGVACITDLMVKEGLINLDFADVRAVMREMGKAMMGTGEATGEKRAMRAAEAAIANPLLDDVNMSGARGLLISITGGSDLTLYEVDEAATRIREEVDPDANVIFGATRDDALDGIVRVSVVATGIDYAEMVRQNEQAQANNLSVDPRIRDMADRIRTEIGTAFARPTAEMAPPVAPAPAPVPVQAPAPVQQGYVPRGIQVAPDIAIRPAAPRPVMPTQAPAPASRVEAGYDEYAVQQGFVPPESERPLRPVRMPSIDELPPIAQRTIDASLNARPSMAPVEKQKKSLMERLTTAGFGRRSEGEEMPQMPRQVAVEPVQQAPMQYAQPEQPRYQPAAQPAPAPQARMYEDDQMEIPAFLRRQSN